MKKIKALLQKPIFKKIISPIVRGGIKMIPVIGTPLAEAVTNITRPDGTPAKHSNLSQIMQWCAVGLVVVDLIANKGENLKAIFDFILSFGTAEVPEVSPAV